MKKFSDVASKLSEGWPRPEDIQHYFLGPPEKRWFFESGTDGARFTIDGIEGTEHLDAGDNSRKEITLWVTGHPNLGVTLMWRKWDGKQQHVYDSKGDLSRLRERVRDMHGMQLPIGLFIPYEQAWLAVKEFLENEGALPKSIEWVSEDDLPPNTFPDPSPFGASGN